MKPAAQGDPASATKDPPLGDDGKPLTGLKLQMWQRQQEKAAAGGSAPPPPSTRPPGVSNRKPLTPKVQSKADMLGVAVRSSDSAKLSVMERRMIDMARRRKLKAQGKVFKNDEQINR